LGGSAVGALLTPAPWRLITDTAIWSENWPGIPRPVRGEVRTKFTNCSLCSGGCAVRARCIGEQPVSLTGVGGGLCPFGLTAHHLPFHPARLKDGPVQEAASAVKSAIGGLRAAEHVAVLDLRPGRTVSWTYRRAMGAIRDGLYLAPRGPEVAVDLHNARTVLSLGAPLLDGWGTPATVFAAREHFRLIQAEPVESRTAALADWWLPIAPGSERALMSAITDEMSPAEAARITGLSADQVARLTGEVHAGPAVVVDDAMSPEVVDLNIRLGGWGKTIAAKAESPVPSSWQKGAAGISEISALADGSVRVLLIDEPAGSEFIAWEEIQKKLAPNALVVAFAPWAGGYGRHAAYVLPTPIYPEAADDLPPAIDSMAATFRIAAPLVAAPAGMTSLQDFLGAHAGLRERADAIHQTRRGSLVTYAEGKTTAIRDLKSEDFWKGLNAGGRWVDEPQPVRPVGAGEPRTHKASISEAPNDSEYPLKIAAEGQPAGLRSPSLSQIYQESNLRLAPNRVALHPSDAAACGVVEGARALLETRGGKREVVVSVDSSVRPGVVLVPGLVESAGAKVVRI
jgi:anaerobic selenocysteine-containing dehydrogenase